MQRRGFLGLTGAAAARLGTGKLALAANAGGARGDAASTPEARLAGMSLPQLRKTFHGQLFDILLPYWDKHGIDHEYGGIMCSLDYDGRLASTEKTLWFLGRAIWVYSFLYNHFGNNPEFLEIAKKTREFAFKYALQKDGWWAEVLTREGKVLRPFSGDMEGMYFIVEGLQQYSVASGDGQSREYALALYKKLFREFNSPDFRYRGSDFQYLWNSKVAVRPQGLWFLNLNIGTQLLKGGQDAEVAEIVDHAVDVIINKHYRSDFGLNNEMLYFDFSRPKDEADKSRFGHSVEALWMVMEEADRRGDAALWNTCAGRIRHHIEAGWDYVYGGLSEWVNVDHPCYEWPVEKPPGTHLELHFTGEYEYMKSMWAQCEVLVATLNIFERTRAEWTAHYFDMAFSVLNEKFSQGKRGYPARYVLFADRRITSPPHVARQDNYHPLRQLMSNILTLDRMINGIRPTAKARA